MQTETNTFTHKKIRNNNLHSNIKKFSQSNNYFLRVCLMRLKRSKQIAFSRGFISARTKMLFLGILLDINNRKHFFILEKIPQTYRKCVYRSRPEYFSRVVFGGIFFRSENVNQI